MALNPTRAVLLGMALVMLPVSVGIVSVFLLDTELSFYLLFLSGLLSACWCWSALPYMTARVAAFTRQRELPPLVHDWWRMELALRVIWQVSVGVALFSLAWIYVQDDPLSPWSGWVAAGSLISVLVLKVSGGVALLGAVSWIGTFVGLAQNKRR